MSILRVKCLKLDIPLGMENLQHQGTQAGDTIFPLRTHMEHKAAVETGICHSLSTLEVTSPLTIRL